MYQKRLWYLILPVITIILQILPYGAVCNFGNPNGEPWRRTFSYFSLTPFGYANFAPLLTAIVTCAVVVLLIVYCFTDKDSIIKITKVSLCVAVVLSLCPLVLGIKNFSVVGGLITVALVAELLLLCFTANKTQQ